MAWAVDRASIGTPLANQAGASATVTLTTNVTVASGAWIFLGISWWTNGGSLLSGVADNGPGLTWSTHIPTAVDNQTSAIARGYAAAGMASGTVITATFSAGASTFQRALAGISFTGGSGATVHDLAITAASTAAHSVTVANCVSGDLIFEANGVNNVNSTNTPDANSTEIAETGMASGPACAVFQYRVAGTSGSLAVGGTWAATPAVWASAGAAFTDAAAAAAPVPIRTFNPIPFIR